MKKIAMTMTCLNAYLQLFADSCHSNLKNTAHKYFKLMLSQD